MLVAAVVCPHPPLMVPEVAVGAAGELDALRAACDDAVSQLLGAEPRVVVVVGRALAAGLLDGAGGSMDGFGVAVDVGAEPRSLPLAHTVACWLLDRAGWTGPRSYYGANDGERPVVAVEGRVGLLVMGDGSARRTEQAPGYLDPDAAAFDADVAVALGTGPAAVAAIDGARAHAVLAAGWPAWQVLAALAAGQSWRCEVLYDDAPYGVGYVVASWLPS